MKQKSPNKNRKTMIRVLMIITIIVFLFFLFRFSSIMFSGEVSGENLYAHIANQYVNGTQIKAKRGNFYDRHGDIIAMDASSYKIYAVLTDEWSHADYPAHVVDKERTAEVLSQYLNMDSEAILDLLNTPNVKQVEFGNAGIGLPYYVKDAIEEENLPGIFFEESQKRLYPNGVFASHIVGLAQNEEKTGDLVGVMGLEKQYNDRLAGEDGQVSFEKDSFGYALPTSDPLVEEPVNGDDYYLTIDHRLQTLVESVINQVYNDHPADAITATVMDAETGQILAATQRPTFDASTLENIDKTWQNLHMQYTYEPGSTFKVFNVAAAIEEGIFDPNESYESGRIEVNGQYIHDWVREGWGDISYLEGLSKSSNTLTVRLTEIMGTDTWKNYMDAFGFGQQPAVDFPEVASGTNPFENEMQKYNTSFGQGLTVTPIQMMQAFSAIANEGKMMKPQFVDKIEDSETGEINQVEPEVIGQPISKETADLTVQYLAQASELEGSVASAYRVPGYYSAIKTGTAQVADPETGTYKTGPNDYIYSVVGMAPASDPKYIVYLTVESPTIDEEIPHSSIYLSNIYVPIMRTLLDYNSGGQKDYEVEEETEATSDTEASIQESGTLPNFVGRNLTEVQEEAQSLGIDLAIVGTGSQVVQQLPRSDEPFNPGQKAVIMTDGMMTMPDLTGWSQNDARLVSEITGVPFRFHGEGYVTNQSIAPGNPLDHVSVVEMSLEGNHE